MAVFNFKKKDKEVDTKGATIIKVSGINKSIPRGAISTDILKPSNGFTNGNSHLPIKFKKLNSNSVLPDYTAPKDTKIDLKSIDCSFNLQKKLFVYNTGLTVDIPEGYIMLIVPLISKEDNGFYIPNNFGIIHSGDNREITIEYKSIYNRFTSQPYQVGEIVAQFIILPYPKIKTILIE